MYFYVIIHIFIDLWDKVTFLDEICNHVSFHTCLFMQQSIFFNILCNNVAIFLLTHATNMNHVTMVQHVNYVTSKIVHLLVLKMKYQCKFCIKNTFLHKVGKGNRMLHKFSLSYQVKIASFGSKMKNHSIIWNKDYSVAKIERNKKR